MAVEPLTLLRPTSRGRRLKADIIVVLAIARNRDGTGPAGRRRPLPDLPGRGRDATLTSSTQDPPGDLSAVGGGIRNAISGSP